MTNTKQLLQIQGYTLRVYSELIDKCGNLHRNNRHCDIVPVYCFRDQPFFLEDSSTRLTASILLTSYPSRCLGDLRDISVSATSSHQLCLSSVLHRLSLESFPLHSVTLSSHLLVCLPKPTALKRSFKATGADENSILPRTVMPVLTKAEAISNVRDSDEPKIDLGKLKIQLLAVK